MRQNAFVFVACSLVFIALLALLFDPQFSDQSTIIKPEEPQTDPVFEPRKFVRDVTPSDILQSPELDDERLERLPALEPPPPPKKKPKPEQVSRPVVLAAGIIKNGQKEIHLSDISPVTLDRSCKLPDKSSWPCGMLARTEMRLFVRGRPLNCEPTDNPEQEIISMRCELDGFDMSAWLVLTGWAEPNSGFFQDELKKAKANERGIWRKTAP